MVAVPRKGTIWVAVTSTAGVAGGESGGSAADVVRAATANSRPAASNRIGLGFMVG